MNFLRNVYRFATAREVQNEEMERRVQNEVEIRVQNRIREMDSPVVPNGYPPGHGPVINPATNERIDPGRGRNPLWHGTSLDKKLAMINLMEFNGSDEDWLKWSRKVKASFGGAGLIELLTPRQIANVNQEANERIYWLLEGATTNGAAKMTVAKYKDTKSGHEA